MGPHSQRQRIGSGAISIHPSRVGWDENLADYKYDPDEFQSTHPVWDGTYIANVTKLATEFQSTHPVWDGTISSRWP